ncbi:MAG TPA: DUF2182 domain-containing protein [Candidatus Angelobacter sp.]|jgi:predicted metal-binding membrane protein|nr:DUF2182 domain-containing protein [Candidatus Angelobacter sp.]
MATEPPTALRAAAVLGVVAAAGWVVTVWQWEASDRLMSTGAPMSLDMGGQASPRSAAVFLALWLPMMAAMMLPAAWPVIARRGSAVAMVRVAMQYLAVWELVGVLVYGLLLGSGHAFAALPWLMDHPSVLQGALLLVAAAYTLSPLRGDHPAPRHDGSGLAYGAACVRASAGWMLALLALGAMDPRWIAVIAVLLTAERLAPRRSVASPNRRSDASPSRLHCEP